MKTKIQNDRKRMKWRKRNKHLPQQLRKFTSATTTINAIILIVSSSAVVIYKEISQRVVQQQ